METIPARLETHPVDPNDELLHVHVARVEQAQPDAEYRCACALTELVRNRSKIKGPILKTVEVADESRELIEATTNAAAQEKFATGAKG